MRCCDQALSRLADGREIAVQLLLEKEDVAESDIILSVRRWHVCDRKVDPAVDLIISKHSTFSQLRDTIATLADLKGFMEPTAEPSPEMDVECEAEPEADTESEAKQLRRLGLAKASAFGPPLDHKVCRARCTCVAPTDLGCRLQAAIKLKWNQNYSDEAMISTHPVSLRDGSVIVYCDEEVRDRRG